MRCTADQLIYFFKLSDQSFYYQAFALWDALQTMNDLIVWCNRRALMHRHECPYKSKHLVYEKEIESARGEVKSRWTISNETRRLQTGSTVGMELGDRASSISISGKNDDIISFSEYKLLRVGQVYMVQSRSSGAVGNEMEEMNVQSGDGEEQRQRHLPSYSFVCDFLRRVYL